MVMMAETMDKNIELQRPNAPFRKLRFSQVNVMKTPLPTGGWLISNQEALQPFTVRHFGEFLFKYARERPEQRFLAEPNGQGGWRTISYKEALQQVNALSQWLLNLDLPQGKPLFVLSDNAILNALLQLAAMQVAIPVMPLSPAYSLLSKTCSRIADLCQRFDPALVYADDAQRYAIALEVVKKNAPLAHRVTDHRSDLSHSSLVEALSTCVTAEVEKAEAQIGLDHTARLLLTSGSTGLPKAVVITQRNMLASGMLWDQVWPFLSDKPLVMVDWLPWNHTAGSHGGFSMVLRHGGTLYIDDGKPVPHLIDRTILNLRQIRPNIMINVPRGLDMIVARMEEDPDLAADIFPNLDIIVYGGAALSEQTMIKLEQLSAAHTGYRIPISASLGSTETTMPATLVWWEPLVLGTLGLPAPGVETKLIPYADKYEVRFKGPSITTGYYLDDEANKTSFDEEGFLITGDAVDFANPHCLEHGLVYAGRLSENFKLATGTWVVVAHLRNLLLNQLHPFAHDVVLAEPNRDELGALIFLNRQQIEKLFVETCLLTDAQLACYEPVLMAIEQAINKHNIQYPASSTRVARWCVLDSLPDIELGELTDKGHINQKGVLKNRQEIVNLLYTAQISSGSVRLISQDGKVI